MLLEINNICKIYKKGNVRANDNISLSVKKGEVFGLLGPNGAGKSTLVNQIVGLVKPTSGSISISGVDVIADPSYARQSCSYQAQSQAPIYGLTATQAIELTGRIRGGRKAEVRKRTNELIERLEIGEWRNTLGMNSSGGIRRLVGFCMAIVVPGEIIILDEPTNDIDPLRRRLLWQEVRALSKAGSTVLLVTHNVLEAERAVDCLAIIDQGRIVDMGTPAELKKSDKDNIHLELIIEPGAELPELPGYLSRIMTGSRRIIAKLSDKNITQAIETARQLKEQGIVEEYSLGPATLEDAYIRSIGRADAIEMSDGESK